MRIYIYVILSFFLRMPAFAPIERELERMILDKSEGLDFVRIRIHSTRWRFLLGRIRLLEVELEGLRIASGLRLERFRVEAHDLHVYPWQTYVRDDARLRSVDDVIWRLVLNQADLEKFFSGMGPLMRGTHVTITPEGISLDRGLGIAEALLDLKNPFKLAGRLEVREPDIHLILHRVHALGFSPNQTILKTVLALVNPVVRAADINRMLRRADIRLLRDHKIHNEFRNIELRDQEAEILGELIIFTPVTDGSHKGDSNDDA